MEGNQICGLVGLVTNHFGQQDVDRFRDLLMFSSTRGKHSTGVVTLSSDVPYIIKDNSPKIENDFYYAKAPVNPLEFMDYPEFSTMMNIKNGKAMLGHTRYATKGAVNAENAHPFVTQDGITIGMHNGTLTGDYKYKDQFGTDSEALINILAEEGPEVLRHINGAWAIVWYDWFNNKLNLIRNNERTLFYSKTVSGDVLYASEEWMLETTIKKNAKWSKDAPVILTLPAYKLMQFDLNVVRPQDTMTIESVKGLEAPKVTYHHNSRFQGGFSSMLGDWPVYEDREWEEADPVVPFVQQQQGGRFNPPQLLSAREALKQSVEARKKASEADAKATAQAGKGAWSKYLERGEEDDLDADYSQHFLQGIDERQRVDVDSGHLFIETVPNEWLHEDEFVDFAVNTACFVCGQFKTLHTKREWLSREEFICVECCDTEAKPITHLIQ